jgi:hypothetical protein
LRDFFRILELRGVRLNEPGKKPFFLPVRPVELPADFPQIIRGRFRDLDPKEIKRVTGFSKKLLNDLQRNFCKDKTGTLYVQSKLTPVERKLLFLCIY